MEGKLIIFAAPSGSGKTTLVKHVLSEDKRIEFSVSATTRPKRSHEEDGVHYYFLSREEFQNRIDNNEFLEWEEVYDGNFYGTLNSEIERIWKEEKHVIFDIDVKGALKIKQKYKNKALAVFVKAPSKAVIAERLMRRGTETEETLRQRLKKVDFEWQFQDRFECILVNGKIEESKMKAMFIVQNFLANETISD